MNRCLYFLSLAGCAIAWIAASPQSANNKPNSSKGDIGGVSETAWTGPPWWLCHVK